MITLHGGATITIQGARREVSRFVDNCLWGRIPSQSTAGYDLMTGERSGGYSCATTSVLILAPAQRLEIEGLLALGEELRGDHASRATSDCAKRCITGRGWQSSTMRPVGSSMTSCERAASAMPVPCVRSRTGCCRWRARCCVIEPSMIRSTGLTARRSPDIEVRAAEVRGAEAGSVRQLADGRRR